MNKMSKKTEYALMALRHFEAQNKTEKSANLLSAKDISQATHAPYEVIARVLQALSSRGILKAEYGVTGGYQLSKDLADVSVFELIETIESSNELAKCLNSEGDCDLLSKCTIITPITELNKKIQTFYKSISISEVLHV